jgi:hypothetical protein
LVLLETDLFGGVRVGFGGPAGAVFSVDEKFVFCFDEKFVFSVDENVVFCVDEVSSESCR